MRPIDADVLIPLIQEEKIEGETLNIIQALGDGLQAETLNQACDRHIKIINSLPTIAHDVDPITQKALEAGKRGEEVRFYIGGRKFAVRELAQ